MGMKTFIMSKLNSFMDVGEPKERKRDDYSYYNSREFINDYYRTNTNVVNERKEIYEDMDKLDDDIISTVLDMGADDATQMDLGTGKSIWCASEDPSIKLILDEFFNRIKIEEKIWKWAREIWKYGDFFLKVNSGEGRISNVIDSTHPSRYCRLETNGTLVGFLDLEIYRKNPQLSHAYILTPYALIHFRTPRYTVLENLLPQEIYNEYELDKNPLYGSSTFLKARKIEKRISLINDALAMTRLARSTLYRIHSVNVGDMTNVSMRKKIMNDYEENLKTSKGINFESDRANIDTKQLSFFREIFVPRDNEGKGQSEINEVGGNVDVSGIADVEYLSSQRFGVLGVPKTYLSFDEAQAFNSLIALDTRYARKIVTLQKSLISGITALCQIELALHDIEPDFSKFSIHLVPVSTNGELDRNDALNSVIDICSNIKNFFDGDNIDKDYVLKYLVTNYLKFPNFDFDALFKKTEENSGEDEMAESKRKEIENKIENIIAENENFKNKLNRLKRQQIQPSGLDLFEKESLTNIKNQKNSSLSRRKDHE